MIGDAYFNPAFHLQGKRCYMLNFLLSRESLFQQILADWATAYFRHHIPSGESFSSLPVIPYVYPSGYTYGEPWPGRNEHTKLRSTTGRRRKT